jgi:hypothetical protein
MTAAARSWSTHQLVEFMAGVAACDDVESAMRLAVDNARSHAGFVFNIGGGPANATNLGIYYIYEQAFRYFQIGAASAVSVILFLATVLLTWPKKRGAWAATGPAGRPATAPSCPMS